jgi:endo-1,4-beta-mannosidase
VIRSRSKKARVTLLATLVSILISPTLVHGHASASPFDIGVNYLSTSMHYESKYLPNATLQRDFQFFQDQGLKIVSLAVVWAYMERNMSDYNTAAVADLKRVSAIAAEHGIQVIIDFHTLMFNNSWTMPVWLPSMKFETVFTNTTYRLAWLNFLGNMSASLSDIANLHSWHMMNEPALHDWACDVTIEEFLTLWTEMKSVVRQHSALPVSIRFGSEVFDGHFNRDPRIYDICDYMALNWYEHLYPIANLTSLVSEVSSNRPVMITEFGYESDDDEAQQLAYQRYITLLSDLELSGAIAWFWRADYASEDPDPPGFGCNLAKNVSGDARPAFYVFSSIPAIPELPVGTVGTLAALIALSLPSLLNRKKH